MNDNTRNAIESLEEYKNGLLRSIAIAIQTTNRNDDYSVGIRNGLRVCKAYIDGLEPEYERCKSSAETEIIRCKDCKHWKPQTNYQGIPLSFGFCESDCMWRSLYGETCEVTHIDTDDDFYCGYAERREDE